MSNHTRIRTVASVLTLALFAGSLPQTLQASEALRPALATLAKTASVILQSRGLDSIGVGEFAGPPAFGSSFGPGIRIILIEELGKVGIREKKVGAAIGLQGRYTLRPQDANSEFQDPASLRIEASLVDRAGQVLTDLNTEVKVPPAPGEEGPTTIPVNQGKVNVDVQGTNTDVRGAGALGEALGATVDLDPSRADGFVNGDNVIKSFDNPTAVVHGGTAVAASSASPFTMEILINGSPRNIQLEDGQPFIQLQKGDAFEIRFTNRANFEAAVTFALDGVSSFQFSDLRITQGANKGQPKYSKWIVPRNKSIVVKGWHRNNKEVDAFLVTDFGNSAASKIGSVSGLGTITATVRATWPKGQDPPEGEPLMAMAEPDIGIGRGERLEQRVREDVDPRSYGQPRAVITVRYAKPKAE